MSERIINEAVHPGWHQFAQEKVLSLFSAPERKIVEVFKRYWYVTKADTISIGSSEYKYFLIKAPEAIANQFNLSAELIVILSAYMKIEPRTLDAFDFVKDQLEIGRVENLCGILISADDQVEEFISKHNGGQEIRIIVPFSYNEITQNAGDAYLIRNKLQKHFYSRDLFAFDDALKTDLFFFGRNQIVMDIISRHHSGQNTGLFGLRKAGKTSILYDVKRKIPSTKAVAVFISCQDPAMSEGSWVDSIYHIVDCIQKEFSDIVTSIPRKEFTELTATALLQNTINEFYQKKKLTVLLMLDEIEHITYGKAANPQWGAGKESVIFWKAVRSAYQSLSSHFTYCIVGTNPKCIEYSVIEGVENPIFNGVEVLYVPGFDVQQTREMTRKLGRIMGIHFDEPVYTHLTEDYGGHPFLMRHVCSYISKTYTTRPVTIERTKYKRCSDDFRRTQGTYFEMILDVLKRYYQDEYEMLKCLAIGDTETFTYFATEDETMVSHLLGYGLIRKNETDYDFKMDVIKDYILAREKISEKCVSIEDRWKYICENRNKVETNLRKAVKRMLIVSFAGDIEAAREYVMKKIYNDKDSRRKYGGCTYQDLFDPCKCEIYLKSLKILILGRWDEIFKNHSGGMKQDEFINIMDILNDVGRFDAHAKIPSNDDVVLVTAAISKLEKMERDCKTLFD